MSKCIVCRSGERINFSYLVSRKFTGDTAEMELIRGGKTMHTQLQLLQYTRLIPEHLSNRPPSYLIISGFVFTQVGQDLSPSTPMTC